MAADEFRTYRLKLFGLVEDPLDLSLADINAMEKAQEHSGKTSRAITTNSASSKPSARCSRRYSPVREADSPDRTSVRMVVSLRS